MKIRTIGLIVLAAGALGVAGCEQETNPPPPPPANTPAGNTAPAPAPAPAETPQGNIPPSGG